MVLGEEAHHGHHGQAAVLDLLDLEHLEVTGDHGGEDAAGVAGLVVGEAVVAEDGVLVDRVGLAPVLPPADLHVVHQRELDAQEGRHGHGQVHLATGLEEVDRGVEDLLRGGRKGRARSPISPRREKRSAGRPARGLDAAGARDRGLDQAGSAPRPAAPARRHRERAIHAPRHRSGGPWTTISAGNRAQQTRLLRIPPEPPGGPGGGRGDSPNGSPGPGCPQRRPWPSGSAGARPP